MTTLARSPSSESPSVRSCFTSISIPFYCLLYQFTFPQWFQLFHRHLGGVTGDNDASYCFWLRKGRRTTFVPSFFIFPGENNTFIDVVLLDNVTYKDLDTECC